MRNGRAERLAADAAAAARAAPTSAERPERDYTPLAAVGGIAVLGLMLLVGVLIGKDDGSAATRHACAGRPASGAQRRRSGGGAKPTAAGAKAKARPEKARGAGKTAKKAEDASA